MALSLANLTSSPLEASTPEQIASVQDYARLLMQGATRDKPITSPWQGARMMMDALSGNSMRNRLGGMQQQNAAMLGNTQADVLGSAYPQSDIGQSSDIGLPQPNQAANAPSGAASIRNNNPGAQWPGPVASRFGATGSQTIGGGNKIASFPDPISGAAAEFALLEKNYSGMPLGSAITKWSGGNSAAAYARHIMQATGLPPDTVITPQLLRSPQGIALAKSMADWEAGGQSPLGPQDWARAQQRAFGGQRAQIAPGQTADASGAIGGVGAAPTLGGGIPTGAPPVPAAGSPASMSRALAPDGPQMAAGTGRAAAPPAGALPPMPSAGNPTFGPQYMQQRPQLSLDNLRRILTNPIMSDEMKSYYMQMYQEQFQPVTAPGQGGTWVQPGHAPGAQPGGPPVFIPKPEKMKEGEHEVFGHYDEKGKWHFDTPEEQGTSAPEPPPPTLPMLPGGTGTPGPQGNAAPQRAPAAGQPPTMLGAIPPGGAKPTQVASLDPSVGIPKAPPVQAPVQTPPVQPAAGKPGQTAALPPAQTAPVSGAPTAPQTPQGTPGPQVAQAQVPTNPLGPWFGRMDQYDRANKAAAEGQAETAKKFSGNMEEQREATDKAAQKSATNMNQLQLARNLLDDPNMQAGFLAKQRGQLQQLKAWLGKNPNAARSIEVFDKIISKEILPELSEQTQNMGQVRVAEFNAVKDSIARRDLTPEGAKAVLDIMMRGHQLNQNISQLMNAYAQGYRMDDNFKLYKAPGVQPGFDYNWQPTLQRYLAANPIITQEQRANWEKAFGSNLEAVATGKKGAGTKPPAPAPAQAPKIYDTPPPGFVPFTPGGK